MLQKFRFPYCFIKNKFKNPIPQEDRFFCYTCGLITITYQIVFFSDQIIKRNIVKKNKYEIIL